MLKLKQTRQMQRRDVGATKSTATVFSRMDAADFYPPQQLPEAKPAISRPAHRSIHVSTLSMRCTYKYDACMCIYSHRQRLKSTAQHSTAHVRGKAHRVSAQNLSSLLHRPPAATTGIRSLKSLLSARTRMARNQRSSVHSRPKTRQSKVR